MREDHFRYRGNRFTECMVSDHYTLLSSSPSCDKQWRVEVISMIDWRVMFMQVSRSNQILRHNKCFKAIYV